MNSIATASADQSHMEEEREDLTGQLSALTEIEEEVEGLVDVLGAMCFVAWDSDDEELEDAHSEAETALRALARAINERVEELREQLTETVDA
jgi:DNA repair exonuclease SbcCD ATPase subunit